jgi:hypothetical protein
MCLILWGTVRHVVAISRILAKEGKLDMGSIGSYVLEPNISVSVASSEKEHGFFTLHFLVSVSQRWSIGEGEEQKDFRIYISGL